MNSQTQRELRIARPAKRVGVERMPVVRSGKPELAFRKFEASLEQLRIGTGAGHPSPETRVVILAASSLIDE